MKKIITLLLVLVMVVSIAGCGAKNDNTASNDNATTNNNAITNDNAKTDENTSTDSEKLKVIVLMNGTLGDKSFYDSAASGVELINKEIENVEAKYVEMGYDSSVWATTLANVSEEDYDIIVVMTYQLQDALQEIAPQHPDKKYIIVDSNVDYSAGDCGNVYSLTFKQNEASYLAGALAAMMTKSNVISAVGGMDIPVINDFIVGYIQGATDVNPDIKVITSYVGDFNNTAVAKELAEIQVNNGSDVCFNVAAQAGLGVLEAAAEKGVYAIGVDADQAEAMAADGKTNIAEHIVSSVMKNVGQAIYLSVKRHLEGTLPYGTEEALGITEGAVGLADSNDYYKNMTTEEIRNKIAELNEKISSGAITVRSSFDESLDVVDYIGSVAP